MLEFTIYGDPVAQGRPRFSSRGGFTKAYDPKESREAKGYAKFILADTMRKKDYKVLDEACIFSVKIYRKIPKSYSKKKHVQCANGTLRPTTKPDLDNYIKLVKDAMSGIVWRDDSIVVGYSQCGKYYVEENKDPRVEIVVETLEEYRERNNKWQLMIT